MACTGANTFSGPLVIRYKTSDNGTRPIVPCDSTNPYWGSPDIWLVGGVDPGTAKVGTANTVVVQVTNISGETVQDVSVQAWVCDFTVGIGPASGLASAGGANPLTGYVSELAASSSVQIQCAPAWTPVAADAALNGGHVCLAANSYSGTDGLSIPPSAFNFCCDSHHAQRNIAVVQVKSAKIRSGNFRFLVANPDLEDAIDTVVNVRAVSARYAFSAAERNALIDRGLVENVKELPRISELGATGEAFATRSLFRATNSLQAARLRLARPDPAMDEIPIQVSRLRPVDYGLVSEVIGNGREVRARLDPGQRVPVTMQLQLNENAPIGSVQTFDVSQTDANGDLVGGVRLVTVVTP